MPLCKYLSKWYSTVPCVFQYVGTVETCPGSNQYPQRTNTMNPQNIMTLMSAPIPQRLHLYFEGHPHCTGTWNMVTSSDTLKWCRWATKSARYIAHSPPSHLCIISSSEDNVEVSIQRVVSREYSLESGL